MKIYCPSHGCHFPQQFEETMKSSCGLWKSLGLDDLPRKYRRHIWGWYFSLKSDEIFLKTGIGLRVALDGSTEVVDWEAIKPGYSRMTERARQEFQRSYFKRMVRRDNQEGLWKRLLKNLTRK